MSRLSLLLRNLWHFRGVNAAVVVGMAVATAVLTGALMVGDSVRGSLRTLALQRLGNIDDALISSRFFAQDLAARLAAEKDVVGRYEIVPAVLVRGGASTDSGADGATTTGGVQIGAAGSGELAVPENSAIINDEIAQALGAKSPGVSLVLSVPKQSD